MMFIKLHRSYRIVVAVCDSNLIGKKFEEGNRQLDLRETFYKDKELNEEEVIELLIKYSYEDFTLNIVGEESINTALKAGVIQKDQIDHIQNIPFALSLA